MAAWRNGGGMAAWRMHHAAWQSSSAAGNGVMAYGDRIISAYGVAWKANEGMQHGDIMARKYRMAAALRRQRNSRLQGSRKAENGSKRTAWQKRANIATAWKWRASCRRRHRIIGNQAATNMARVYRSSGMLNINSAAYARLRATRHHGVVSAKAWSVMAARIM